ncbi:MAG: hypothetical protein ACLRQU_14805 [Clostridium sp.]
MRNKKPMGAFRKKCIDIKIRKRVIYAIWMKNDVIVINMNDTI